MPDRSTIGGRIESARHQLGFSINQLARRIGVQRKTLENWENDRSEPRVDKLMKLAGVIQVPMIWLLTGDTPQALEHAPGPPETAKIAQKLDRALAMQQELAALLIEVSADVTRLQRVMDTDQDLAA